MKRIVYSGLLILLTSLAWAEGEKKVPPQRIVEVELEKAEGAKQYIVEIRHFEGALLRTFNAPSNVIKFRAPIGDYEVRAKVEGIDGRIGEFSPWERVQVAPRKVKTEAVKAVNVDADSTTLTGHVKLAWTAEETAKQYKLKVYAKDQTVVKEMTVDKPEAELDLPTGDFHYSVTTIDGTYTSEETVFPQTISIGRAQLTAPEISIKSDLARPVLKWSAVKEVSYWIKLENRPFLAETYREISKEEVKGIGQWSPPETVPPGECRVTFWTEAMGWKRSPDVVREFVLKPNEADLSQIDAELAPILKIE